MDGKELNSFRDLIAELAELGYGSVTVDELMDVIEKAKEETEKDQV